ncbi:hypothetical protein EVAR_77695_1 [Eumeta japonica]|uniref:Uncharacterized protein n=1 Tax=Eumeta variegata TaxID=151549 RepID=A0A4C1TAK8_EUMVA|nr:hypothetical protein EVAR_77695_1 [Eumeta japonica]
MSSCLAFVMYTLFCADVGPFVMVSLVIVRVLSELIIVTELGERKAKFNTASFRVRQREGSGVERRRVFRASASGSAAVLPRAWPPVPGASRPSKNRARNAGNVRKKRARSRSALVSMKYYEFLRVFNPPSLFRRQFASNARRRTPSCSFSGVRWRRRGRRQTGVVKSQRSPRIKLRTGKNFFVKAVRY